MARPERDRPGAAPEAEDLTRVQWLALAAGFVATALWLAWPAIDGTFLSDDYLYIVNNVYVHGLSWENIETILDPYGPPTVYTLNYAPVHLLLHAAEWELWGDATRGYHVVNAVLHGLTSLVLVPFFRRAGIPLAAALGAAALFLVHPANVEVVSWIFQLKTIVSLALGVGALLLHERRPALAAALFALAILTKISLIAALPVAATQAWVRAKHGIPPRWGWLGVWALVLAVVMLPEMTAFQRQDDVRILIHEDVLVHARTIVAIAGRYLVMAASSYGVATFHEPPPAEALLDPWWLFGLVGLGLLAWRSVVTLLRREEEAVFWMLAAGSFAPVSQVFPFIFPMGDRYLYGILPGLFGGVLLALLPAFRAGLASFPAGSRRGALRVAAALCIAWVVVFAGRSHARAPVFRSVDMMMVDSAFRYPDGMQAHLLRGHEAARRGDVSAAARAFQTAVDLGFSDLAALITHPELVPILRHPEFAAVLRDLALRDLERLARHEVPKQTELMRMALAYKVRDDIDAAIDALERALLVEGPFEDEVRAQLETLQRERAQARGRGAGG